MAAPSSQPRLRRRWWQRLARLVVVVAVLLTVLYVTFPLWAPCGLIREYIRQDLEKKLGVGVGLRALSLSWSQGIVLEGLTIQSDESFDRAVLADVERLSAEYSPYNLLVHHRLEWMTLDRLKLFPRIDDKGNSNLAVLGRIPTSPETRRMLIRNASVDISLPWQDRPLRLEVSDMQVNGGRTTRLGSVTMSAGLAQGSSQPTTAAASRPDVAPLSVQLAASPAGAYEAASAAVAFSNVDLAQLNLPRVPGSPLAKLSGRCSGSLTLQINRQAIVDGFRLDVTVRDLDAQPTSGLHLPVFDKAEVRADATFDLAVAGGEGKIEVRKLTVRVPGLEIAGHATVLADIMEGDPEAIKSLDLKGVVYPDRLAALAGYQAPEGEPKVEGPVAVEVSAQHLGDQLTFRLQADATGSGISRGGSPIKLAGRALKLSCRGVWDHTADQLVLEEAQLALGGNLFKADGKVSRPLQHLRRLDTSRPLSEMAGELAALNLQGSAEIKDTPALLDLLPPFKEAARNLTIQGPLGGQWSVQSTDAIRLQCSLRAPAGTAVSIQGIFDKPLPAALALDLSAVVDPTHADLRDVNADLTLEQPDAKARRQVARASVNRAKVTWRRIPEQPDLSVAGRFDAEKAEKLLACLTSVAAAKAKASGSLDGQFDVAGWGDNWKGSVKVDLARLEAAWQDLFRKAANEEAVITSEFAWAKGVLRADADIDLGQTHLKATGHTEPDGFGAYAELSGEIHDAAWAVSLSPALASRLQGCQFRGPFTLKASGTRGDRIEEGTLDIVADNVQCRFAGPVERVKPAGVPLRLSVAAQSSLPMVLQPPLLELRKFDVQVGGSELHARGSMTRDTALPGVQGALLPHEYSLDLTGKMAIDDAASQLLPELQAFIRRQVLSGTLSFEAHAGGTDKECRLKVSADAKDLDVRSLPLAAIAGGVGVPPAVSPAGLRPAATAGSETRLPVSDGKAFSQDAGKPNGPLTGMPTPLADAANELAKPRGIAADVAMELSLDGSLTQLTVRGVEANLGPLHVLADAEADLAPGKQWAIEGLPYPRKLHVSISTRQAAELAKLAPRLEPNDLKGDFFFDFQWRHPKDLPNELVSADLHFDELTARLGGKDVRLAGEVSLSQVTQSAAGYHFGRVRTDGLTFSIGPNAGMVVADVKNVPEASTGEFDVQCSYLDDQDLAAWVAALTTGAPASAPATQTTTLRPPGPGAASRKSPVPPYVLLQAQSLLADIRQALAKADLTGHVSVDHLRTLDPSVNRTYDAQYLNVRLNAKEGHLQASVAASVNAGDYRRQFDVMTGDLAPVARIHSQLRDLVASEDLQPQLARFFPGNTVYGTLSKTEDLSASFEDVLANMIDPRYAPRFTGKSVTVTTDGLLEGRSAPKIVAAIFPGLNLTKYRYNRMTAFADLHPDGTAANDMIFDGQQYNTYIEGTTDANNYGTYDVGLILGGNPQSPELNHQLKLGRLLLLTVRARIEDGKMYDQEVAYPWPNEALGAQIRNSLAYRLWINSAAK